MLHLEDRTTTNNDIDVILHGFMLQKVKKNDGGDSVWRAPVIKIRCPLYIFFLIGDTLGVSQKRRKI